MGEVKRILCLANSRKLSGRCVAGREWLDGRPGAWIRPVSDREHEEVSLHERRYEDGNDPCVLDVIDIPLRCHKPASYQVENWLLDPDYFWARAGVARWGNLAAFATDPPTLWLNGSSTYAGLNDQISLDAASRLTGSLHLVKLGGATLHVVVHGLYNPKRRVQAAFTHRGVGYRLWVTDPAIESTYLARDDGKYDLGDCYITVSLGEPFQGNVYKLVAAIIPRQPLPRVGG